MRSTSLRTLLAAAAVVAVCAPAVCAPAVWADEPTEWAARHILVAYKGAERAQPAVTRTKEEAKALAAKVAAEAAAEGADFAALSTT